MRHANRIKQDEMPQDGLDAGGGATNDNGNTNQEGTQTEGANIRISANSNEGGDGGATPAWVGDDRYFQSGAKAGQLKPAFRVGGLDAQNAAASLFDPAGGVSPSEPTPGAALPQRPTKPGRKSKAGKSAEDKDTIPDYIQAAALYNMVLTGGCKLISPEYEQSAEMQKATLEAATEYFKTQDVQLPPWVGLAAITMMNITAAFKTPSGQSRLEKAWGKLRAWYISKRI